jgi:hypothetical protein
VTSGDPLAGLTRELGSRPPARLAALPAEELEDLAAAVGRARVRQASVLRESVDAAVREAPLPLRPALRRALTG